MMTGLKRNARGIGRDVNVIFTFDRGTVRGDGDKEMRFFGKGNWSDT